MKKFIIFLGFYLVVYTLMAQQYSTKNKKAIKNFEEASLAMKQRDFDSGIALLESAVKRDPNFTEAHFALAKNFELFGQKDKMIYHYEEVVRSSPEARKYVIVYYLLANAYFKKGEYALALNNTEKYLALSPNAYLKEAEKIRINASFAIEAKKKALTFNPTPLNINRSDYLQYFPVLTADQSQLIFTARLNKPNSDENIFISKKRNDSLWETPEPISEIINTVDYEEGTCTISADGKVLVFTSCNGRPGYGRCDLFFSEKYENNQWSEPINLGPNINSQAWESQPSLSADGKTLFFVSDRNKENKEDIYVSYKQENGKWSPSKSLAEAINTSGSEVSPFIHVNGKTLFFSSTEHTGFGGYDLFYSELGPDGEWTVPKNLGYPINNHLDQVSLYITSDGKKGYYTDEQRSKQNHSAQLIEFDVPEEITVKSRSNYVKGHIYDAKTKKPLLAEVDLFDILVGQKRSSVNSDVSGAYLIVLNQGSEYALEIHKKGYAFKSMYFNYTEQNSKELKPIEIDIYLDPLEKGIKFALNNIFFDYNKFELEKKSKIELDALITFMKINPEIKGEISGHTDDIGDDKVNMELSLKRAKSVYDYLIKNGIEASRIFYKGYGETQPTVPNTSEANRQLNRRIEFKIL